MAGMKRVGLYLEAVDCLFFRGGRALVASIPGVSTLPSPQTLAGALCSGLLRQGGAPIPAGQGRMTRSEFFRRAGMEWLAELIVAGPWLAQWTQGGARPYFALPRDLRKLKTGGHVRMQPRNNCPGWKGPAPRMLPVWLNTPMEEVEKDAGGWLSREGMEKYLAGGSPSAEDVVGTQFFLDWEERTGIGIDRESRASEDGKIYATKSLRMRRGKGFYAEVVFPIEREAELRRLQVVQWGGERKLARLYWVEPSQVKETAEGRRQVVVLTSPAFFAGGWAPEKWKGSQCRAAAVSGQYAVSGWDLAAGQAKPTRFGVDAGTVYWLEPGLDDGELISEGLEDKQLGYGSYLRGRWTDGK